jgi:hypothetical protein
MSYPINYPKPQGANIQIFQGGDAQSSGHLHEKTWVKPQGASFVWFTLIGAGGGGDNATTGGGSGAVTNFMGPAFLIPDSLAVIVGKGGPVTLFTNGDSSIYYQQKNRTGYLLLNAAGASGATAGSNLASNYFSAMGFYQSVAGQSGITGGQTASATTFLSGGGTSGATTANYGYSAPCGYFQMQPIIVGVGGGGSGALIGQGGVGCGGGYQGDGGDGMVIIITW